MARGTLDSLTSAALIAAASIVGFEAALQGDFGTGDKSIQYYAQKVKATVDRWFGGTSSTGGTGGTTGNCAHPQLADYAGLGAGVAAKWNATHKCGPDGLDELTRWGDANHYRDASGNWTI